MAAYEYRVADFACVAAGAAVLGSGGGGSYTDATSLIQQLASGWTGTVLVQDYDGKSNCCVLAMMGSPDAGESLQLADVAAAISNTMNVMTQASETEFACLVPVEVGPINSLIPLIAAVMSSGSVWVVNGDGAGRAVPELVQTTYSGAANLQVSPCVLANDTDGSGSESPQSAVLNASTAAQVEALSRGVVSSSFGSIGGIAAWVSNASNSYALAGNYIPQTLNQAWALGQYLLQAVSPPATAEVAAQIAGITGRDASVIVTNFYITSITEATTGGFDAGVVRLDNAPDPAASTETHYIYNLNESLIMYSSASCMPDAIAPDSICYYSEETGRGATNSNDDLAAFYDVNAKKSTGKTLSVIKVAAAPQLYGANGVLASFAALLRNIGYAGALPGK